VALARRDHPDAVIAVVGESMGAATAIATFGSDDPPAADRLVLAAPAVWGWKTLPDLYAVTLWAGAHTLPWRHVSPPRNVARRIVPSDNTAMLRAISGDPNMIFRTRIDAVYGLVNLMQDASERAGNIAAPTLFLYGEHDMIVPRAAAESTAKRLGPQARTALYANGYHMLTRDLQAEVVFADILAFLKDARAPLPSGAPAFVESGELLANR
jgi:alpha-beta hydrolase superfamily lysophospholipase